MLEEIIHKVEPPCFIYEIQKVKEQISKLKKTQIHNISIFYAMKANPLHEILSLIEEESLSIETTSIGEMERALSIGFKSKDMLVTGPGKSNNTLDYAINNDVGYIIIESVNEARRVNQYAERYHCRQPILIRVSPANTIQGEDLKEGFALFGGKPVKYGIDEEDLQQVLPELMSLQNLSIDGIHLFAASGVSNYKLLIKHIDEIFNLVQVLNKSFPQLSIIDFGGGFGYSHDNSYEFDVNSYFSCLDRLVKSHQLEDKRLFLELGTYIAASCGTYLAEIMDIKYSRGEYFLIVDGGIHHLLRPSLVSNHSIQVYGLDGKPIHEDQNTEVNIVGNLCHPIDILSRNLKISVEPKNLNKLIGGKVVIFNCGAYGANFSVRDFSLHPNPNFYVIDTNENLKRCLS